MRITSWITIEPVSCRSLHMYVFYSNTHALVRTAQVSNLDCIWMIDIIIPMMPLCFYFFWFSISVCASIK